MTTRVSLAQLAAADIRLRPSEAVTIVTEICRRCGGGQLRGVPPAGVIKLTREGALTVEGPTTTGDDVARAAQLLNDLLAEFDAAPEYRASGGLRLVIGRALGTLDLPPYSSLADFCLALRRFSGAERVDDIARALFHVWERAGATRQLQNRPNSALTISDIRRARRATGLSLSDVAAVAEVPATQLRDLEWGYPRTWRADDEGKAQVIRYARAAGLDEGLVLSIAWPMIEEARREEPSQPLQPPAPVTALVPVAPQALVFPDRARGSGPGRYYARWAVAAVAILVLTMVAIMEFARLHSPPRTARASDIVLVGDSRSAASTPPDVTPTALAAARAVPEEHRQSQARRTSAAVPSKRRPQRKPTLFERELFRIVFK